MNQLTNLELKIYFLKRTQLISLKADTELAEWKTCQYKVSKMKHRGK